MVGESKVQARIIDSGSRYLRVELNGVQYRFDLVKAGRKFFLHNPVISSITLHHKERFPEKETETAGGLYIAPMPSQIIKVLVKPGQKVRAGEELLVLSSMKMENTMVASEDGVVEEIHAMEGTNVEAGFLLLQIKEADQPIKNK